MTRYAIADIECDGFLQDLTRVHCMVVKADGVSHRFRRNGTEDTIPAGLQMLLDLASAGVLIAFHNGIAYDIPAIRKVYPQWTLPETSVLDTLVFARLVHPDLSDLDRALVAKGQLPARLQRSHSLEAWGHRLGNPKEQYTGDFQTWTQELEDYNAQDVESTETLLDFLLAKNYSQRAIDLEQRVAWIISRQSQYGVAFDDAAAAQLCATLQKERLELETKLRASEPHLPRKDGQPFTPKRDNAKLGYTAGVELQKIKWVEFNPGSRDHCAYVLTKRYGWQPTKFTATGKPELDEEALLHADAPPAAPIRRYLLIQKRLGQIAEGSEGWLRHSKHGVIHGRMITNGAVTGRGTHMEPNLGQVPRVGSVLGEECRALFVAREGRLLVGADQAGVELRCLGHYMAPFDEGAYGTAVVEGKQSEGSDVHSLNAKALGLNPQEIYSFSGKTSKGRDFAKTFIYAFLYGAGGPKLARTLGRKESQGNKLKAEFLSKTPALKKLIDKVQALAKKNGYLPGLDGRRLKVRKQHAALNTLLQSAGALLAKQALVFFDDEVSARGWRGRVQQVLWVHDEIQVECVPELAEEVGRLAVQCFERAGTSFNFRVPIGGEYKVGANWAATH